MPTSAHADRTDFLAIFGEFETAKWADVGIGPYKWIRKTVPVLRKSPANSKLSKEPKMGIGPCTGGVLYRS